MGLAEEDEEMSEKEMTPKYESLEMRKIRAKLAARRQNRIPEHLKKCLEENKIYCDPVRQKPPVAYRTVADFPNENLPNEILQKTGEVSA